MSDSDTRIEQFRKMAADDPNNELGHFSLGRALLDAGRDEEAVASLNRAIELNPSLSKAYQLAGGALMKLDRRDEAVERLTAGVKAADQRGDRVPRQEMARMLEQLGAPVHEAPKAAVREVGEGQVLCRRCGKVGPKLSRQPFKRPFGKEIYDNICANCWEQAVAMGVKVVNELRLPLNDPASHRIWDQHIREFLNLQD